jgi:hypothetical protein
LAKKKDLPLDGKKKKKKGQGVYGLPKPQCQKA